jgi:hypothetical protein
MARQTYKGPLRWLVVDDGDVPAKPTMGQDHVRRSPSSAIGTLPDNLLEAVKHFGTSEAIFFIEDDDWYAPNYLTTMISGMGDAWIVGIEAFKYYNVAFASYMVFDRWNCKENSSGLYTTGIKGALAGKLVEACNISKANGDKGVDAPLWWLCQVGSRLIPDTGIAVGMKGLPGRKGLGSGHAADFNGTGDPNFNTLKKWVGEEDAKEYIRLHEAYVRGILDPIYAQIRRGSSGQK